MIVKEVSIELDSLTIRGHRISVEGKDRRHDRSKQKTAAL